jgi:hypothetical protein
MGDHLSPCKSADVGCAPTAECGDHCVSSDEVAIAHNELRNGHVMHFMLGVHGHGCFLFAKTICRRFTFRFLNQFVGDIVAAPKRTAAVMMPAIVFSC